MGLPPIISLLTATFPILRRGRSSAEDFLACEEVFIFAAVRVLVSRLLADAAVIDVTSDLFKNHLRVNLFDIRVSLQQLLIRAAQLAGYPTVWA